MFCVKCGQEIKQGYQFCVHCGQVVAGNEPKQQVVEQPKEDPNEKALGNAIAALVCGICGLLVSVVPFLSIPFGHMATKLSKNAIDTKWYGMAKAARYTGKLSIIYGAVAAFIIFIILVTTV